MESGGLEAWLKKEGDELAPGDVLAHVTTDKATVDFECQDDGYLAKILLPEGSENVTVGTPVAIVVENEEDIAAFKDINVDEFVKSAGEGSSASAPAPSPEPSPAPAPAPTPAPSPAPAPASSSSPAPAAASGDRVFASPYARLVSAAVSLRV